LSGRFGPEAAHLERTTAMRQFAKRVLKFVLAEDGPTAVEYAIMLALIIVVCIGSITVLGQKSNSTYTRSGAAARPVAS
jgi:pilus assembly protein Flp/PilA